jgi:hypothetical protein
VYLLLGGVALVVIMSTVTGYFWLRSGAKAAGKPDQTSREAPAREFRRGVLSRQPSDDDPPPRASKPSSSRTSGASDDRTASVKRAVRALVKATLDGNHEAVLDYTYDGVVDALGGRGRALELLEAFAKSMKDLDITVLSYETFEPGEFHTEEDNVFVIVPTRTKMKMSGETLVNESFLLGISADGGTSWQFIDGGRLRSNPFRDQMLPKLPPTLVLPKRQESWIR